MKKKIIISIICFILILLATCFTVFKAYYSKMNYKKADSQSISSEEKELYILNEQDENIKDSDAEEIKEAEEKIINNMKNESSDIIYIDNVFNILLIGSDNRETVSGSRSDCMILCSINKKTKQITLTSFMRDCYVKIPNHDNNRLNSSYAFGGTQLLINTLEQNFKINIDRYAQVDFFAFMDIIDVLGGIDIDLSKDEIRVLNLYLGEINTILEEEGSDSIEGPPGVYHLNGKQALAYCRNRYTGNSDFSRTERQRIVLSAAKDKIKDCNIIELNELLTKVLPYITTDLTEGECLSLILDAPSYLSNDLISNRVPYDNAYKPVNINKMSVLSVDFDKNIEYLYRDIYNK